MKWNSHYICLMVARRFPSIRCFLPIVMLLTGWTSIGAASSFEVKVFGKGIPMILIPGIACSGDVWKSTVVQYQDRYECHVITLAGFAGVPPEQSDWFLDQVKNDLIFYIKEKHLQKPVIVGHALGGFVAVADFHRTRFGFAGDHCGCIAFFTGGLLSQRHAGIISAFCKSVTAETAQSN